MTSVIVNDLDVVRIGAFPPEAYSRTYLWPTVKGKKALASAKRRVRELFGELLEPPKH